MKTSRKKLVFLDEAEAKTNMTRLYGRSTQGQRVYDKATHGWKTTMILSLRDDGSTACMIIAGAINAEIFPMSAKSSWG